MSYYVGPTQVAIGSPYAQAMAGEGPMQAMAGFDSTDTGELVGIGVWAGIGAFVGHHYAPKGSDGGYAAAGAVIGGVGGFVPVLIFGLIMAARSKS